MKWFRRKKKVDVRVIEISMASLARQILHDGVLGENTAEVAEELGLPPASEDVHDMEEQASEDRLEAVKAYFPLLEAHAEIMGSIALAAYKVAIKDSLEEGDEELLDQIAVMMRMISFSSSLTALTMLVDMGLVTPEVGVE